MAATTTIERVDDGSLTKPESARLAELEEVVERGLETFLEVGQALMETRDLKLYRVTHRTFGDHCKAQWGFTARQARQLVQAAKVGTVVPVANEAQAREIASGNRDEEEIRAIWGKAVALANERGVDKLTVNIIRQAGIVSQRGSEAGIPRG